MKTKFLPRPLAHGIKAPASRISLCCVLFVLAMARSAFSAGGIQTPLSASDLDSKTFAEWVEGKEKSFPPKDPKKAGREAQSAIWTKTTQPDDRLLFGDSKTPGNRYLRVGFTRPIPTGTIVAIGNVSVSVLKPGAPYPGNLADDTQWIPAERLENSQVTGSQVTTKGESSLWAAPSRYALWVLPPGTETRAVRFAHTANASDRNFSGRLEGVYLLTDRFANLAPQAAAAARSSNQTAGRFMNESLDLWENIPGRDGSRQKTIAADPEWIMLIWPQPVTLDGLALLHAGFGSGEVQVYTGAEGTHPRDAADSDWKTLSPAEDLRNAFSCTPFGKTITTRAIRLRMTATSDDPKVDSVHGLRVCLGDWIALHPLGNEPLTSALLATGGKKEEPHGPIPIHFNLPEDGVVTLVIEDADGKRVRNLVSETAFPKGDNIVWWDGTDDLGRDKAAIDHALYSIPRQLVTPGEYRVRGLWHKPIVPRYEFSVYAGPTNPPWHTPDHTGAWLANHEPPMSALFVAGNQSPTTQPAVFLGCSVSEGVDTLAWVDLEGRKKGGVRVIGGAWTGAPYMARDDGPHAVPGVYAYVGAIGWKGQTHTTQGTLELRVTALTANTLSPVKEVPPVGTWTLEELKEPKKREQVLDNVNLEIGGIAVRDGGVIFSMPMRNQLYFIDTKTTKAIGQVPLDAPHGLIFDAQGRLLVLSGTTLLRFEIAQRPDRLPPPQKIVTSGLEEPVGITLDSHGNIYISDHGNSHQVKVFSPDGKFVRAIGHPGSPKAGPYDPLHMNHPYGLTVDAANQLWVMEHDFLPKRVSVWSLDGQLLKAFYGPAKYGGGGSLDPRDKTRFYYSDGMSRKFSFSGGMEFSLDWEKGESTLTRIYCRDLELCFHSGAPETVFYNGDKRYFTNCFASEGSRTNFLFIERDGIVKPIAGMGAVADWVVLQDPVFKPYWPEGMDLNVLGTLDKYRKISFKSKDQVFFIWSDLNGDGKPQPNEVQFKRTPAHGVTVMDDLSFCVGSMDGNSVKFSPVSITPDGVPRYDMNQPEILAKGGTPEHVSADQVMIGEDGQVLFTFGAAPFSPYSVSGFKNGKPMWSYPNLWPGVFGSHGAPVPDRPGELIGPTRLLGNFVKVKGSDVGQIWGINGNFGDMYLFTADGLFITQVCQDTRIGSQLPPRATRGMSLADDTFTNENFYPSLNATPDGQIYMVDGNHTSILHLDGMDTLRKIPDTTFTVTADQLKQTQEQLIAREAERKKMEGSGVLEIATVTTAPTLNGNLKDWTEANWVDIDKSGTRTRYAGAMAFDITGAIAVTHDTLYAAWKTGIPNLLENSGDIPMAPFKTGGCLDLMIGTDSKADPNRMTPVAGDIRLLITRVQGHTRALLYEQVAPGTPADNKVPFSSPMHTITFDLVEDVSAKVQLQTDEKGNFEIAVPLSVLGLKPQPGMKIRGDIGVLRGDGTHTQARIYWSNKATGLTADVPGEALLTPGVWGHWVFK